MKKTSLRLSQPFIFHPLTDLLPLLSMNTTERNNIIVCALILPFFLCSSLYLATLGTCSHLEHIKCHVVKMTYSEISLVSLWGFLLWLKFKHQDKNPGGELAPRKGLVWVRAERRKQFCTGTKQEFHPPLQNNLFVDRTNSYGDQQLILCTCGVWILHYWLRLRFEIKMELNLVLKTVVSSKTDSILTVPR